MNKIWVLFKVKHIIPIEQFHAKTLVLQGFQAVYVIFGGIFPLPLSISPLLVCSNFSGRLLGT